MSFIIGILIAAVSAFLLIISIRFGVRNAERLDDYFSVKTNSDNQGFQWWFRIPTVIGMIPEYFYAMILGHDTYFKKNWWSLRASSYIAILLFIATLKSRSEVLSYYSLDFISQNGLTALITSGGIIMLLNIITLMYISLFVIICIESINMHGIYAFIRILYYSLLCLLMANLTIVTLSVIVFVMVVYIIFKIIKFLFFSSNKRRRQNYKDDEDNETAGDILKGGFREFKVDLKDWEDDNDTSLNINVKRKTESPSRKRPKVTVRRKRRKKTEDNNDDIPRLHPD